MSDDLSRECRRCNAGSGHPCRTPTGRATKPHAERADKHEADAPPGLAGYREGCRCSVCREANAGKKRDQRDRRKQREADEARAAAKASLRVVGDDETADETADGSDWEPEPFTVAEHLLAALATVTADDALTRYRKAHAITLAQVLDNPIAFRSWAGITRALITVVALIVKDSGPIDGEGAELAAFFEMIANGRKGG